MTQIIINTKDIDYALMICDIIKFRIMQDVGLEN